MVLSLTNIDEARSEFKLIEYSDGVFFVKKQLTLLSWEEA